MINKTMLSSRLCFSSVWQQPTPSSGMLIRTGNTRSLRVKPQHSSSSNINTSFQVSDSVYHMDRVKRIWYLSPMRAAKVQASLRIRAVSPEPSLLAHTSSESRGTFRQKPRSMAPLNGWACAVKICHDGMLEDTNSLGAAHMTSRLRV